MKKYIITAVLASALVVPAFAGAQSVATSTPGIAEPAHGRACDAIYRNLTVGHRGADVTALQTMMQQLGYLKVQPTGYFGSLTADAVKKYQKDNKVPTTGFVGPLTRVLIKKCSGNVGGTTTPAITITAPKGGETWAWNSNQKITWTDSNKYIAAPKYDIKLQKDLDCKPGQPCIMLFPVPFLIARNVMNTTDGYTWRVGTFTMTEPARDYSSVTDGKYRVLVCPAGNTNIEDLGGCAKSDSFVNIVTGTSTATTTTATTTTATTTTQ